MERQFIPWDDKSMALSKSGVQQYGKCPFRFNVQVIGGVGGTTEAMTRGKVVHDLLEKLYKQIDKNYIRFTRCVKILIEEYMAYLPENEYTERFLQIEIRRFKEMRARNRLKYFFPKFTEVYSEDRDIMYYGTADRVDKMENGNYIVIDYKTGPFHKWLMTDYRFEMAGYRHLLEKNGVKPITRWAMIFLGEKDEKLQVVGDPFQNITIRTFYNRLERVRGKIRSGDFSRKSSKLCDYCPYEVKVICHADMLKEVE